MSLEETPYSVRKTMEPGESACALPSSRVTMACHVCGRECETYPRGEAVSFVGADGVLLLCCCWKCLAAIPGRLAALEQRLARLESACPLPDATVEQWRMIGPP